jgi:hypothetical protein
VLKPPELPYTAEQKKTRLKAKGDPGSMAEAAAAEHNKVKDGNDMSGPNAKSKMYQVCSVCDAMGGEIDHVNRDESGKITEVVEVKGGRCNVDKTQLLRQKELADSLGAKVRVKLQGSGAGTASDVISKAAELKDVVVTVL